MTRVERRGPNALFIQVLVRNADHEMAAGLDHANPVSQSFGRVTHLLLAVAREQKIERPVVDVIQLLRIALRGVVEDNFRYQWKQLGIKCERVAPATDIQAASDEIARCKAAVVCPALHRNPGTPADALVEWQLVVAAVRADPGRAGLGRIRCAGLLHFQ